MDIKLLRKYRQRCGHDIDPVLMPESSRKFDPYSLHEFMFADLHPERVLLSR